jgi:hypothetical protein
MPGSKPTAWLAQENRKTFPYKLLRDGKVPGYVIADSLQFLIWGGTQIKNVVI